MSGCVYKLQDGRCGKPGRYLSPCIGEACQYQTPSNYDLLISKTPEEMAETFGEYVKRNYCFCPNFGNYDCRATCEECWADWLKSPADKGDDG